MLFVVAGAYPAIERRFTKDNALHNLLQRPRDVPVRTSLGVMAIATYTWLVLCGINDWVAYFFHVSLNATTWAGRIGLLVIPPLSYWVTYRCAWACSSPTGRCSSTASRPASSGGCRTVSSSRCTSRWAVSTRTATRSRWSTRALRAEADEPAGLRG